MQRTAYAYFRCWPLLACLILLNGCDWLQPKTEAEYLTEAKAHLVRDDRRSGIIALKNALRLNPRNAEARYLLGKTYLLLGNAPGAEKELRWARKLGIAPDSVLPLMIRAILMQGDLDRVIAETETMPHLAPSGQAALLAYRAEALILKGKLDKAEQALQRALQLDQDSLPVLASLALLHANRNDLERARQLLKRALELDPRFHDAWSLLGEIELAAGDYAAADQAFTKAFEQRGYPHLDLAKRALARIHMGRLDEADADLQQLKKVGFKKHPYVNYVQGLSYLQQKRYAEALEALQIAYAANPDYLPTQLYLATAHLLQGNLQQAADLAEHIASVATGSQTARYLLARVKAAQADYRAAERILSNLLRKNPDDPTLLRLLIRLSLLGNQAEEAVTYARRLAAVEPDSSQTRTLLLLTQLMAGVKLERADLATERDYTTRLLHALDAFRRGELGNALAMAKALAKAHPGQADPLKLAAAVHLATAQWEKAEGELRRALELQPDDASVVSNLAKILIRKNQLADAHALLQPFVTRLPGAETSAILLAAIEARRGNSAAALEILQKTLQANPAAAIARAQLAAMYLRRHQPHKVLELTRNLPATSRQAVFHELQGKAYMQLGDIAAARSAFEDWVAAAPASAQAHFLLADTLAKSGETARAQREVEQALKIDPNYLPARIGEIRLLVLGGKIQQAQAALAKLKQEFGQRPEVLGIGGWFALGRGDYAAAVDQLRRALAQRPDSDLTLLLARAYAMQQAQEQAKAVLRTWLTEHPEDIAVRLQLAELHLALGEETEAQSAYREILKLRPDHVPTLNNLAWLNRNRAPRIALDYAQKAYQLAPNDPVVLDTLAMLLLQRGEKERALALVRQAADLRPGDPEIRLHLGQVLLALGRNAEARRSLQTLATADSKTGRRARALLESLR